MCMFSSIIRLAQLGYERELRGIQAACCVPLSCYLLRPPDPEVKPASRCLVDDCTSFSANNLNLRHRREHVLSQKVGFGLRLFWDCLWQSDFWNDSIPLGAVIPEIRL